MKMLSPLSTNWSWPRRETTSYLMGDVFSDFDRIVNTIASPAYTETAGFHPSCDISETKDHYLVSFDVPGVKKDEIKIEVKGNELVISGERQRETKDESNSTLRHERVYGKFERTFTLPSTINAEKIEAHCENGVLNIALPKTESAKPRTVQIQTGQSGFLSKLLGSKKEATHEVKENKPTQ